MSFARFSTDDTAGKMRGYVGEGRFTDDPLETFGGAGVVEIPQMQKLLHYICEKGFEHHVAANSRPSQRPCTKRPPATCGWDMYWHHPGNNGAADGHRGWGGFRDLSVRVSIVDSERGLLASAVAEYPLHRKREDPEYATQSHEDHMRALAAATREAVKQAGISRRPGRSHCPRHHRFLGYSR